MKESIETIEYRGHTIDMYYDHDPMQPDDWGNDDCFLVYDHRQFYVERKGFDPQDIVDHIQETRRWFYDGYYVFPVYAYIHSGVTLSMGRSSYPFTCPWDTSFRGFALVKRMKGWSYSKKQAEKIAESVVQEWDHYCTGQVYGYSVDDGEGDSCWGYYGPEGYKDAVSEAKHSIDYQIEKDKKSQWEYLKTMIRNKVPFEIRKPCLIYNQ